MRFDVHYDASGTRLASAGEDGTVRLWDVGSSLPQATFSGHQGPVLRTTFLDEKEQFISIGSDQTLRILDAQRAEEVGHATSRNGRSRKVALSQNARFIVTADAQGFLRLWSRNLEEEIAVMPTPVPDISALAVSAEAKRIAAVTANNRILLWSFEGQVLAEKSEDGLGFDTVEFSPSGKLLAIGHADGRVTLHDGNDGHSLKSWKAHNRSVGALAFSPDETLIATTGWEGGLSIRDIASGDELGFLLTEETHIHAVSFSPAGRRIATAGQRGTLAEWSLDQLLPPTVYIGHENIVFEAMPTPTGEHIASVGRDGTIRLWETSSGVEVRRLRAHGGSVYSLDISPDGSRLATRGSDGKWRLWELPSGRLLRTHPIDHRVRNIRFSPDGTRIATGAKREGNQSASETPAIGIWDVTSGEEITRLLGHRGPVMRMDFHPAGTHLVSTSQHDDKAQDGRAFVWDLETSKAILTLHPEGDAVSNSALWSPTGTRIYTGHSDGRVCFWDASTGDLQETIFAHGEMVGALELSPDGKRLLTSAWYSEDAKLWHAESGEFQFALNTGIPGISDVGFDPKGEAIIAAGMDGGLKRFTIEPPTPGFFEKQRRVQKLATAAMQAPKTVLATLKAHEALQRESSHHKVDAPSSHQVSAAALDTLADTQYRDKQLTASKETLERAQSLSHHDDRSRRLQWLEDLLTTKAPEPIDLTPYVGRFQEREFRLEGNTLYYRHRFFDQEWPLTPIAPDHFLVVGDEMTQLRFHGDRVEGHYFQGGSDYSRRDH